jgi:hypothetical protein
MRPAIHSREVLPLIEALGFVLESTSINHFAPIPFDTHLLYQQEKALEKRGRQALAGGRYFPGFFVFHGAARI